MKPSLYVKADGTIVMDFAVFRAADPYEICATLRNNIRTKVKHPSQKDYRVGIAKMLSTTRNTSDASNG